MKIQLMNKIKDFQKNPVKIFGLAVILLSLILLFGCHFILPDFFTNKELAEQIVQVVEIDEAYDAIKHLFNPRYEIYNWIFQIWGWAVALLIFSVCFKVNEFKKFMNLTVLNQKNFVYLWINISYIIWGFMYVLGFMVDIDKSVYNYAADSTSIPFIMMIGFVTFIGILYYITMNLLAFVTFNTRIKRIFYNFFWAFIFLFWIIIASFSFSWKFSYYHLIMDLYYFIMFIFIIYAIGYTKNKS